MNAVLKFCIVASLFISQTSLGMIRVNRASLIVGVPETSNPKLIYFSMTKNPTTGAINIIIDSDIENKNNEVWDNLINRNSWQQKVKDSIRSCACDVSIRIAHVKSVKDILDNYNFRIFPKNYVYVDFNQDFYISNDDSEFAGEIFDSFHGIIWGNRKLAEAREARGGRKEKREKEAKERRERNIEYRDYLVDKISIDEAAEKRRNDIPFLIEENKERERKECEPKWMRRERERERKEFAREWPRRDEKSRQAREINEREIEKSAWAKTEKVSEKIPWEKQERYERKIEEMKHAREITDRNAREERYKEKYRSIKVEGRRDWEEAKSGHRDFESTYIECVNCHKPGHLAKDCRSTECNNCGKFGHRNSECTYIECKNCHKPGHLAKDCRSTECNKCGKFGHRNFECTYIKCDKCHKPGHLAKDCRNTECNKCGKFGHRNFECTYIKCDKCHKPGHLAKDCLLCTNCLQRGHKSSTCTSCYICGASGHRTRECHPPQRPRQPTVRDSDPWSSYPYIQNYPRYIENWKKKRERYYQRKKSYCEFLSNMGKKVEIPQNAPDIRDEYDDSTHLKIMKDVIKENKRALREMRERQEALNQGFNDNYFVPSCPKCGECVGGGCDGHP